MKHTCVILGCALLCSLIKSVVSQDKNVALTTVQNAVDVTTGKSFTKKGDSINVVTSTTTVRQEKTPKPSLEKSTKLICPGKDIRRPLFTLPCRTTRDCSILGKGLLCCSDRCLKGIPAPKPEPIHSPTFFGLVDRVCPKEPLAEILEITECYTDEECSPRICCPEKIGSGEFIGFCRTAEPIWDRIPVARRLMEPLRNFMSYMQCTPPPPPFLDLFPKACENQFDCFPNLCCQERGRKFCRPPKRSLLALVADVGQRLVPSDAARKLIERVTR